MGKRRESRPHTTWEKANEYDALNPLLVAMHKEFQELSKKKPEAALSKSKIEFVNRLLRSLLALLQAEPQRQFLDLLQEDDIPQNSDVVLVLSQYCAAMAHFRGKYYGEDEDYEDRWFAK